MDKAMLLKRLAYHENMVEDKFVKSALHDAKEYIANESKSIEPVWVEGRLLSQWTCGNCKEPLMVGYKFCPMCGKSVIWR